MLKIVLCGRLEALTALIWIIFPERIQAWGALEDYASTGSLGGKDRGTYSAYKSLPPARCLQCTFWDAMGVLRDVPGPLWVTSLGVGELKLLTSDYWHCLSHWALVLWPEGCTRLWPANWAAYKQGKIPNPSQFWQSLHKKFLKILQSESSQIHCVVVWRSASKSFDEGLKRRSLPHRSGLDLATCC